jgi:hypothetical protein
VPDLVGTGTYLAASVVGLALMAGVAAYLVSLVRRRS